MRGTVKWFNQEKGYGFVRGEDGQEYFTHLKDLAEGTDDLAEGQAVEFEPSQGPKGLKALGTRAVAVVLLALAMALGLCGCNAAQIAALREAVGATREQLQQSQQVIEQMRTQRAELATQVERMPAGDEREKAHAILGEFDAAINQGQKVQTALATRLESYQAALEQAQNAWDVAIATLTEVQQALPEKAQPWGGLALFLATLAGGAYGVWQRGRAQKSDQRVQAGQAVVRAIEWAKKPDGTVAFGDPETQRVLSLEMGAAGKAFVDAAQGQTMARGRLDA